MKLTTANKIGLVILVPSFIVLVYLAVKLTTIGTGDPNPLFFRAMIVGVIAGIGQWMFLSRK